MKLNWCYLLILMFLVAGCLQPDQDKQTENKKLEDLLPKQIPEELAKYISVDNLTISGNTPSNSCEKPKFTEYFVDPKYIHKVGQVGTVHGSGQFTVGRSYISIKSEFNLQKIPIYAPTNMTLTRGAYYQVPPPAGQFLGEPLPDYALYFDAGCGVEVLLAHLKEVIPQISQQFSEPKSDSRTMELKNIKFKAGDLIGYFIPGTGVAAFDFMVHDQSVVNKFANQARQEFGQTDNLIHVVCPYDLYGGEKKQAYYNLLGKECGPVSRDFPGTISGLWFLDKEIKKSMYDYSKEGIYGSLLPIVGDEDRVIIGTVGYSKTIFLYPGYLTYKDPKEVTDEHCYQIYPTYNQNEGRGYVFFKLSDNETLKVFYSEDGNCPAAFPATGWATYYR